MCAKASVNSSTTAHRHPLRVWLTRPFVLVLRAYQLFVSPLIGANCRFMPTCSQYGIEALGTHGILRGGWLTIRRVLRCRPGGGSGYDPVPEPRMQEKVTE